MRFLNRLDSRVCSISKRSLGFLEDRMAPLTLMILAVVLVLAIQYWDSWSGEEESFGTAIRNLVLVLASIAALSLAIWRSKVAERQADTAQRGLLNDRYQKGAEMLGSEVLSVRLGGIYALARLAREHPGDYHTQIMSLFCAFVRHPPKEKKGNQDTAAEYLNDVGGDRQRRFHPKPNEVSEDVLVIMKAVRERSEAQIKTEKKEKYRLALSGTNLFKVVLFKADLSDAYLIETNLNRAMLSHADLTGANLSNADMRGCIGLTQEQLDQAVAQEGVPPNLAGVVDANTGEPLVWRGASPRWTKEILSLSGLGELPKDV